MLLEEIIKESIDIIEFINIKNIINGWISFKPFDPIFSCF